MAEFEETFNRIKNMRKSVMGIVICTTAGKIIKSTFGTSSEKAKNIAEVVSGLTVKAKTIIRDIDPSNDLTFMRVKSRHYEIMVAPDKEYLLVVMQCDPNDMTEDPF
mmetsp:Transcript_94596/g.131447  ORF Transcript_94596/g.131447 Transcript_94596/m.131447 type:complete len:107 (-) Transcript_94596:61-381(-)